MIKFFKALRFALSAGQVDEVLRLIVVGIRKSAKFVLQIIEYLFVATIALLLWAYILPNSLTEYISDEEQSSEYTKLALFYFAFELLFGFFILIAQLNNGGHLSIPGINLEHIWTSFAWVWIYISVLFFLNYCLIAFLSFIGWVIAKSDDWERKYDHKVKETE